MLIDEFKHNAFEKVGSESQDNLTLRESLPI